MSIKELSSLIKCEYYNGEYKKETEDKNKCYINNSNVIVGFEANNDTIFKVSINSLTDDYPEYKLNNKILQSNNILYINLNDIPLAFNILISYNKEKKKLIIQTAENRINEIQGEFEKTENDKTENDKTLIDVENINNKNALVYNLLVISNNGKYGVLNASDTSETVIGNKYSSLEFEEYTEQFIASNSNGYGVIDTEGNKVIELKYDEISIINYNPLLYKVKLNGKYGVINKSGNTVIKANYDKIGYVLENSKNGIKSAVIIKNLSNKKDGIVVNKSGKYGLLNISNEEVILDFDLDAIYAKTISNEEKEYYVKYKESEYTLEEYLDAVNKMTVNVTQ